MAPEDEAQPKRAFKPVHIALVAAGIIGLILLWLWPRSSTEPAPEPIAISEPPAAFEPDSEPLASAGTTESRIPEVEPPTAPAEPEPLPSLDESDPAVARSLEQHQWTGLSGLLTDEFIIRKAVRAVVAAANGEWVYQHRPIDPPTSPFEVAKDGDTLRIAPTNFARYEPYIDALVSVDAFTAAKMYTQYYPLLEEAYGELGLQQGNFHGAVLKALALVESTPAHNDAELVQPSVAYKFKNAEIEGLPQIQKLLIRMGPENQTRLQAWLTELERQLSRPSSN